MRRLSFYVSGLWLALTLAISGSALGATINPGDILVADFSAFAGFTGGVIQVTPATGAQTTVSSGGSFIDPTGIAIAPNGDIIVVEETAFGSGGVIRVNPTTGGQTTITSAGGFVNPRGITIASNGDIYIADYGTVGGSGAITKIDGVTSVRTVVATGGLLVDPIGMAFAPNGDLYVADFYFDNGIGRIIKLAAGTFTQSIVASGGSLVDPHGITIASNGDLFVTDLDAFPEATAARGGIIRINPMTGAQTTVSSGGYFVDPSGVALASDGALLVADYAAIGGVGSVIRVDPSDGSQTMAFPGGVFVDPIAIAVAPGTPPPPSSDLAVAGPLLIALPTTYTSVVVSSSGVFTADAQVTVTGNITIQSGGAVTHTGRLLSGLVLDVMGTLDVQSGGFIDLDAKGLKGGRNGSVFVLTGETFNASDVIVAGSVGGFATGAGASYGGRAPNTSQGTLANTPYGLLEDPRHLGSGGAAAGSIYVGGNGGGRATITVPTCLVNGTIRANGQAGTGVVGANAGGGSGGGIRLNVGSLSGTGAIQARGGSAGNGGSGGSSGGGGRIAIHYDTTSSFPAANISARGGNVALNAAAGTIYLKDNAQSRGDLVVDNAGVVASVETPLRTSLSPAAFVAIEIRNSGILGPVLADVAAGSYSTDHLRIGSSATLNSRMDVTLPTGAELELTSGTVNVLDNSVFHLGTFSPTNVQSGTVSVSTGSRLDVLSSSITLGNGVTLIKDGAFATTGDQIGSFTIQSGGVLTHTGRLSNGLVLDVTGTLDVQSGGFIDLDAKGLKGGRNGSVFVLTGETFDAADVIVAGSVGGFSTGAGASYGGRAPNTSQGTLANAPYGLLEDPRHLGSGGAATASIYVGGNGGGRATITAPTCIVNGTIRANGQAGTGVVGSNAGGGSGGAMRLNVGSLSGTGAIQARGGSAGNGASGGSSGGGGRIAIQYDASSFPAANINARGGSVALNAAAGTIYLKDNAQSRGDLYIDNGGVGSQLYTPVRSALSSFRNLTVSNSGFLEINAQVQIEGELLVNAGGKLGRP